MTYLYESWLLCLNSNIGSHTNSSVINLRRIVPGWLEAVGLVLLTVIIIALGSMRQLLDYYGLSTSNDIIKNSASSALNNGLSTLDGFSLTDKIVTFTVWAVIGLLCITMLQTVGRAYREFQMREAVSSNRYIHPKSFSRTRFWGQVIQHFLSVLFGIALLLIALYCLLAFVLPVAIAYTRDFMLGGHVSTLVHFLLGLAILFGWLWVITVIAKYLVNRNQLFAA